MNRNLGVHVEHTFDVTTFRRQRDDLTVLESPIRVKKTSVDELVEKLAAAEVLVDSAQSEVKFKYDYVEFNEQQSRTSHLPLTQSLPEGAILLGYVLRTRDMNIGITDFDSSTYSGIQCTLKYNNKMAGLSVLSDKPQVVRATEIIKEYYRLMG